MKEMILASTVLVLLLILLRRVLRGRIHPGVQYALWLLAAARLLIPGTLFTTPVSVMGAAEELRASIQETYPVPATPDSSTAGVHSYQPPESEAIPVEDITTLPRFSMRELVDWPELIWKTGMAGIAGTLVLSNLTFYLRLRRSRRRLTLPDTPWAGKLPVYEADGLASPCLFGLFRPAIYLNEAAMDAEQPEHILAHEYAHYRHGDHLWALLRSVCLIVHWYNPLVWWAAALSRRDCELACDEAAVRRLGEAERIDYGQTLLTMVSRDRDPAALLHAATTMTAGRRAMAERIALLIKRPRMRKITVAAVALAVCVLVACFFGGTTTEPPVQTEPSEAPAAVFLTEALSSQAQIGAVTDPKVVSELWALYQNFAFDGTAETLTRDNVWSVMVTFQDREKNVMANFTIFDGGLCWLEDDYDTIHVLQDGQMVYEAFREACRTAPRDMAFRLEIYEKLLPLSDAAAYPVGSVSDAVLEGSGAQLEDGPAEGNMDMPGDGEELYSEEIAAWRRWFQAYMDAVPAAPEGDIRYDSAEDGGLYMAVHDYLLHYAQDYFGEEFARDLFDCEVQVVFDIPTPFELPQTLAYTVQVTAAFTLPSGELYSETLGSRELETSVRATDESSPASPSGELMNEWQRSFAGFVFEIPAAPDREEFIYADDNPEISLSQVVMAYLDEYARDYVARNGNGAYNTRFTRIVLEEDIPSNIGDREQLTVRYQIECVQDRTYEGQTYALAPQTGEHLTTVINVRTQSAVMGEQRALGGGGLLPEREP